MKIFAYIAVGAFALYGLTIGGKVGIASVLLAVANYLLLT